MKRLLTPGGFCIKHEVNAFFCHRVGLLARFFAGALLKTVTSLLSFW